MIELIAEKVKMPPLCERKFKKEYKKNKWSVVDTETGDTVFNGKFEDVCLAWHNLNKKHYIKQS
jgi:hypothetical protein